MAAATLTPPVSVQTEPESESAKLWAAAQALPCDLRIDLHAPGFTVRDLMQLDAKSLVATGCKQTSNVPVIVNGQVLAWAEFEVIGQRLAVRLTELI